MGETRLVACDVLVASAECGRIGALAGDGREHIVSGTSEVRPLAQTLERRERLISERYVSATAVGRFQATAAAIEVERMAEMHALGVTDDHVTTLGEARVYRYYDPRVDDYFASEPFADGEEGR